MRKPFAAAVAAVFVSLGAFGTSFIVPSDRELVQAAKAIVIATSVSSHVVPGDHGMVYTVYELRVEEVIKGEIDVTAPLEVMEPGGFFGDHGVAVADAVRYEVGERALIFLDRENGAWRTWSMVLGKFNFVRDRHGKQLLVRGADDGEIFGWDAVGTAHEEPYREEDGFLRFLRTRSASNYFVSPSDVVFSSRIHSEANSMGFHACDYVSFVIAPGSCGSRWKDRFDQPPPGGGNSPVNFIMVGTATGVDGPGAVQRGESAWNGDSQSNVQLTRSAGSAGFTQGDGVSSVHFDDNGDTAMCGGAAIGCTLVSATFTTHTFDGGTFGPITDADVAMKAGFTTNQTFYDEAVAHELGHGIGLRHSQASPDATSSAVMHSSITGSFGANLTSWDHRAVSTVYNPNPGGGGCVNPSITSATAFPSTINSGQSSTLTVTASGTTPTFQWYVGSPPNTSNPVPGGNSASVVVSPTSTTTYWVRVTACSTNADSSGVTVTVSCTPVITAQPADQQVTSGGTATLSVAFTSGSSVTVAWYRGVAGDTSNQVGTGTSFTTPPITATTNFWARLTNACGTKDTRTVTVSLAPTCTPPSSVVASISPASINAGQVVGVQATVGAGTSPLSFQWFRGTVPDESNPIAGATAFAFNDTPGATTSYWVRVNNACGFARSNTVTVTVAGAPCVPPNITGHPQSVTIGLGASTTLTVVSAGTNLQYAWFQGTTGQTANPVGTNSASFTTPALTSTTQYWVRVSNECGTGSSFTATVTVIPGRHRVVRH